MLAFALVHGRLSLRDFENLTTKEWAHVARAISDTEDYTYRDAWKRTQLLYFAAMRPHTSGNVSPAELLPLPWEPSNQQQITTDEDAKRILEKYND